MKHKFGVVLVAMLLAGCSSTSTPAAAPATPATVASEAARVASAPTTTASSEVSSVASNPTAAAIPAAVDLAAVADKIGCGGYAVQPAAPMTTTYATCMKSGSRVQLYAFASPEMSAAFLESVKAYGVTAATVAIGDGFMVAPKDPSQLPAIRSAVG